MALCSEPRSAACLILLGPRNTRILALGAVDCARLLCGGVDPLVNGAARILGCLGDLEPAGRFLLRARDWTQAFTPDLGWSHPDYPLLVPLTVTRVWAWLGTETPWIPFLLGGVFAAAALLVVIGATAMLNPPARFTAGLLLIGSPWIWQVPSQTADVPASVFFAASFALAAAGSSNERPAMMMLSGIAASMAAWTKNEDLLFARRLGGVPCEA